MVARRSEYRNKKIEKRRSRVSRPFWVRVGVCVGVSVRVRWPSSCRVEATINVLGDFVTLAVAENKNRYS